LQHPGICSAGFVLSEIRRKPADCFQRISKLLPRSIASHLCESQRRINGRRLMKVSTNQLIASAVVGLLVCGLCPANVGAQPVVVTAGANMDIDFNQEVTVGYSGFVGAYFLEVDLIHDPSAGPMIKRFQSPITDTNDRILLDATQLFPQSVWEDFHIVAPVPGGPPASVAVQDWHEEIWTDGWEWVLPGDARFPTLFPPGESLVTRNGEPHPWSFSPSPTVHAPHQLWVQFPPIHPGETLDIHKALLWVGTPGNRIWGDDVLDDGSIFDESLISVWEYPTVPEPSTWSLLALGMVVGGLMVAGRRSS
jgi:hypothetical protein